MALQEMMMELSSCPKCNICKWIPIEKYKRVETQACCPSLEQYQFHAFSAAGKQHMSIGIVEGKIPVDEKLADVVYKCHFCGACEFSCKAYRKDMDLSDTFDELRKLCAENGLTPKPQKEMIDNLVRTGDCQGRTDKIKWTDDADVKLLCAGQTADTYLFTGSEALFNETEAKKTAAVANLLMSKGMDLITAGTDEANSGYEAFVFGEIEAAKKCAEEVKAQIEASGAKTVVVMDAHSFGVMRNYYPKYGVDLGVEIKHITEVLADMIAAGQITFTKEFAKKVTYHDPCYLGRRSDPYKPPFPGPKDMRPAAASRTGELGIYDAPRAMINAVPGTELIEMDRIRGYAWCCGGGAGVAEAYPELKDSTAKARMEEALLTGADILVTACGKCQHILSEADGMQVMDIIDLVLTQGGAQ